MKKVICAVVGVLLVLFSFPGCLDGNIYIVPDGNCIISVPENFLLGAAVNTQTECEKIETAIQGVEKIAGRDYYSVTKGGSFEILPEGDWFSYSKEGNYGCGKLITGFVFGEETVNFNLYDIDNTFNCESNCNIDPIYSDFMTVGVVYFANIDIDSASLFNLYDTKTFFNADGTVKQQDNLYYILLKNEISTAQDCWDTNFTVNEYNYEYLNGGKNIKARFSMEQISIKSACSVCKTAEGGYFISYVTVGSVGGVTMDIGDNVLEWRFS